jgi:hypothetical protein
MLHLEPEGFGHTLKLGEPRPAAEATRALTVTALPAAFVLQTQITKLAFCPGLTRDELENVWTRTHSCGFLAGAGEVVEGVGVGVVELDGEGEPLGLVLERFVVFDADGFGEGFVVDGFGEGVWLGDGLALDDGLELGAELELEDELELGLGLALSELVGAELALASLDLTGVALALVLSARVELAATSVPLLADFVFGGFPGQGVTFDGAPDAGATTVEFLGTEAQAVLTIGGFAASAAIAWPNTAVERNAKPDTAPTTVGLTTACALTRGTSLQNSFRPDHPDAP